MKLISAFIFAVFALPALAQDIVVEDAYARIARPGAPVAAAFFVVRNDGEETDRLIGARTDLAAMAEVHTHIESTDGVMQMRPVEGGLEIIAGGEHHLKRGGDHIMIMGLSERLEQGDMLPLTLVFENAGEISLEIEVDNKREQGKHDNSHD